MIKLTFQYTRQEYVQAVRQYLFAASKLRKFDFVILAICIVMSIYYVINSYGAPSLIFLILVVLALLIYAWVYVFMPVHVYNSTAKFHEEYQLTFSDAGILFKTATIDSSLTWDVYRRYLENARFFYLVQTASVYTVIPKRVFVNDVEADAFRTLVAAKLSKDQKSPAKH